MEESTRGRRRSTEDTIQNEATPKSKRRRRASTGGFRTKLEAPQRPGFVRRWADNTPGRIAEMQDLGYDFAEADTRTDGLGTRAERFAGTRDSGEPQKLILMETPIEEYAVGVEEKEERLKPFEQALRAKRDTTGQLENAYSPKDGSSLSRT